MFIGTIRYNIDPLETNKRPDGTYDDEPIMDALRIVGLLDHVLGLPD